MAFGQPLGPPASARRVEVLLELLQDAGHIDFRDARGPMGFTQRQGNGKFTVDEVEAFIDQLEAAQHEGTTGSPVEPPPRLTKDERTVQALSSEVLAAELQRRGWAVMEP